MASGLSVGLFFGVLMRHYRVCMVAAVSNMLLIRHHRYMVTIVAAALIAILGTQLLEITGTVAIATTNYRDGTLDWLGVIYGGLLFGIGASLAGGDAARTVVRAGEGNITGVVALVIFMLAGYMTQYGWLEPMRLWVTAHSAIALEGGDAGLAPLLGISKWIPMLLICSILLAYIVAVWKQHGEVKLLVVGMLLGAVVVPAWYLSGVVTFDEFAPDSKPASLTVVGALSRIGSTVLMKGTPEASIPIFFVIGLFVASLFHSLITRHIPVVKFAVGVVLPAAIGYWLLDVTGAVIGYVGGLIVIHAIDKHWDPVDLHVRSVVTTIIGAALMGIGGTISYGCNIGQGISGLSTLSLESIMAVISIFFGVWLGMLLLSKLET